MFKKDSYLSGVIIGIIFPVVCFGILYGVRILLVNIVDLRELLADNKLLFASSALNVIPLRYLYVSRRFVKAAEGVLLVTVVMIISFILAFR